MGKAWSRLDQASSLCSVTPTKKTIGDAVLVCLQVTIGKCVSIGLDQHLGLPGVVRCLSIYTALLPMAPAERCSHLHSRYPATATATRMPSPMRTMLQGGKLPAPESQLPQSEVGAQGLLQSLSFCPEEHSSAPGKGKSHPTTYPGPQG